MDSNKTCVNKNFGFVIKNNRFQSMQKYVFYRLKKVLTAIFRSIFPRILLFLPDDPNFRFQILHYITFCHFVLGYVLTPTMRLFAKIVGNRRQVLPRGNGQFISEIRFIRKYPEIECLFGMWEQSYLFASLLFKFFIAWSSMVYFILQGFMLG